MKSDCSVSWCSRESHALKMCRYHYRVFKQGKNPETSVPKPRASQESQVGRPQYRDDEERFQHRTHQVGECLIWTGAKNKASGHGYFTKTINGKSQNIYAHRFAWLRAGNKLSDDELIDHACRNPACVNVEHLRIADKSSNGANLSGPRVTSKTGVRNVFWSSTRNMYQVKIQYRKRQYHGGFYASLADAKERAEKMRAEVFGEFAGLG